MSFTGDWSFLIWSIDHLTGQGLPFHIFAVVEIITIMSFCWKTVTHPHAVLESFDFDVILTRTVRHGLKPLSFGLNSSSFQDARVACFRFGSLHGYTQGSYRKCSLRRWSLLLLGSIFCQFALWDILEFSFQNTLELVFLETFNFSAEGIPVSSPSDYQL